MALSGNSLPPRLRGAYDSFAGEADQVLGQYLRGQLLVMLILSVFYSTGLALFGLDLALPIGIFTGLAIFVPYVGFGLGLVLVVVGGCWWLVRRIRREIKGKGIKGKGIKGKGIPTLVSATPTPNPF